MNGEAHNDGCKRLSDQLREIIKSADESQYKIARAVDVDASQLSKFIRGQRNLGLAAVDRVGEYFDLEIRPRKGNRVKKG